MLSYYSVEIDREREMAGPGAGTADITHLLPERASSDGDVQRSFFRLLESLADLQMRCRMELGIGDTDFRALSHLTRQAESGRSVRPGRLAAHLGISTASVSVLVDRLEERGLVVRERVGSDGRAVNIVPIIEHDSRTAEVISAFEDALVAVAHRLHADEKNTVIRFLDALNGAIAGARGTPPDESEARS